MNNTEHSVLVSSRTALLGEILVTRGFVTEEDVTNALRVQASVGGRIGALLMRAGAISEDILLECLASQLDMPVLGRDMKEPVITDILSFIELHDLNEEWLLDQQLVIWQEGDETWFTAQDVLNVAMRDALDTLLPDQNISVCLTTAQTIARFLGLLQSAVHQQIDQDLQMLIEMAEQAPTIELVNNILAQAADSAASDVHIEPEESGFKVRLRVDGVLHNRHNLPMDQFNALVSRIKLISNIDIAERRLPQDGRFSTRTGGKEFEIRVSSLPGVNGESIVLRLLPKERDEMRLDLLGMFEDHRALFEQWITEPHGIILVTGPTGSGKSTTLYAVLDQLADGVRKIITVEDPVEFKLPGVTQVQAHSDIGLTFANALRSILRQDPDVVMVGEVRDLETAQMAIQASLTGHLVLSTVHTNDAVSAFTRLHDMGIERFLIATPIIGVQAQRLVRKVCEHCAEQDKHVPLSADHLSQLDQLATHGTSPNWLKAIGCDQCNQTGYHGRIGIYEMVPVDEQLQEMILNGAAVNDMRNHLKQAGFRTLRDDGLLKARMGLTTIDEVLRITSAQNIIDESDTGLVT